MLLRAFYTPDRYASMAELYVDMHVSSHYAAIGDIHFSLRASADALDVSPP